VTKVVPMYSHVLCEVNACHSCPFAFLARADPLDVDHEWRCQATKGAADAPMRLIGSSRPKDSAPGWCPLKIQPVLVKYVG